MTAAEAMTTDGLAKPKCEATTRAGGKCGRPAGWGTDHVGRGRCKLHGGSTPAHKKAVAKQDAAELVRVYGMPVETTHQEAAEQELWRAQGIVTWLSREVSRLEADAAYGPVGGGQWSDPRQEPHVWINQLGAERDRLARVIRLCHDLGMDERHVRLAEQQGMQIAGILRVLVTELGLALDDPNVQRAVRAALTTGTIEGTAS